LRFGFSQRETTRQADLSPLSQAQENEPPEDQSSTPHRARVRGSRTRPVAGSYGRSASRAKAKIGLQNLAYNIRRLVMLERMAAA
jgi:hypothetical protein